MKSDSEEDKYVAGIDLSKLPLQARQVLIASGQFLDGKAVTQRCPQCHELLAVEDRGTAWLVSCKCGLCNDTHRGL